MKIMYRKNAGLIAGVLIWCLIIGFAETGKAQLFGKEKPEWGYGVSVIYNFHATGWGAALRAKIPVKGKLFAVPEVSYFPSFNDYHEYYAGAALHYELFSIGSYIFYPLAGGYYNNWINAEDFAPGQRKKNNFVAEAGAGLVRSYGCIRPFIENRYNFKWKEDNLRIGIYWYPRSCSSGGGGRSRKEKCPPVVQ